MGEKFDFSGYATRNDLQCADGRVIKRNAFLAQDNQRVPLVWQHQHNDPSNVLGHALLENRPDGVYCYGTFNNTELGRTAKELVANGDVSSLSIYANQLKHNGSEVLHGVIREVSLVIAGANPGAFIDNPVIAHSGETVLTEAIIYQPDQDLVHDCTKDDEAPKEEKEDKESETDNTISHSDEMKGEESMADSNKTVGEIFDELTEEQKKVVYFLIGQAIEDANGENNTNDSEGEDMKHNVFDNEAMYGPTLSHADVAEIFNTAKRYGSLKDACEAFCANNESLMHSIQDRNGNTVEYGIADIDLLFPDYKALENEPGFIKRNPDGWVTTVMNGVHHTPFSRIKMLFADLREDDARAKGYAKKGQLKKEEVFGLLKRTVDPTTVYKKQKLDRDDIIDITDFSVVAWLKGEMRMMLDEEIARAILFGDGRSSMSADKISETNIIPVCKDASLYNIVVTITPDSGESVPHAIINGAVRAQNNYEGSGNTIFFTTPATITEMLLLEDGFGHRLYKDMHDLALAMNVNKIEKVPASVIPADVYGVILDLDDYNVGADKGGNVSMFEDFDIDYNQEKYLIETRCSGALRKPFSAITLKKPQSAE